MAKKTPQKRDGVYQRKDRPGLVDIAGRTRRAAGACARPTRRTSRRRNRSCAAELLRVEQAKMLGHTRRRAKTPSRKSPNAI